MVCALFCAKGPYFFRQNIQFTAYNNDVKFAHNLFCSLDISQKYILYPSFTMCNHFHALLLQFIDTVRVCFNKFDQIWKINNSVIFSRVSHSCHYTNKTAFSECRKYLQMMKLKELFLYKIRWKLSNMNSVMNSSNNS